jgi:hypothetical protein
MSERKIERSAYPAMGYYQECSVCGWTTEGAKTLLLTCLLCGKDMNPDAKLVEGGLEVWTRGEDLYLSQHSGYGSVHVQPADVDEVFYFFSIWQELKHRYNQNKKSVDYYYLPESLCQDLFLRLKRVVNSTEQDTSRNPIPSVNRLFSIFKQVRLAQGYVLDYSYLSDNPDGSPVIYARNTAARPRTPSNHPRLALPETDDLEAPDISHLSGSYAPFLKKIEFSDTGEGCFEFALFYLAVQEFYRRWHALSGRYLKLILTQADLESDLGSRRGDLTLSEIAKILRNDWRPRVFKNRHRGEVRMLAHDGSSFLLLHFTVELPNQFIRYEEEVLVQVKKKEPDSP